MPFSFMQCRKWKVLYPGTAQKASRVDLTHLIEQPPEGKLVAVAVGEYGDARHASSSSARSTASMPRFLWLMAFFVSADTSANVSPVSHRNSGS